MGSPKRSINQRLTPPGYHVDWDSPSTKTGTVKRRPNSCGDALKIVDFHIDPEFNGGRENQSHDRKCSLDENTLSRVNSYEYVEDDSYLNNAWCNPLYDHVPNEQCKKTEEEAKDVERKICDILGRSSPAFCSDISEEGHKFLIDKTGKVRPETATLIKDNNVAIVSKLKSPKLDFDSNHDNKKIEEKKEVESDSLKKMLPKLKLNLSPPKSNEKMKFKMFSMRPKIKEVVCNEYVKLKFEKKPNKTKPRLKSKIPITPVDGENKILHLSPNKKYTITSGYKIRCDKDNYVVFDPDSGFDSNKTNLNNRIVENTSDTDSGILSPISPMDVGGESNRNSRASESDAETRSLQERFAEQEQVSVMMT